MPKNALKNADPDPDFVTNSLPFPINPERRLLAAMLYRAIVDCTTATHVSADARRSAWQYLFGELSLEGIEGLSFHYVCGELDLDPEVVREVVRSIQAGKRELPLLSGQTRGKY